MLKIAACTDVGLIRNNNEDFHFCDIDNGLMIVADGAGGHHYGEIASKIAVECCYQYLVKEDYIFDTNNIPSTLIDSISFANKQVIEHKKTNPDQQDMGTTLTCVHIKEDALNFAWVGDSRVYLIKSTTTEIQQLSIDHTLYQEAIDRGEVSDRYKKSILSRMLGNNPYTRPDGEQTAIGKGDFVLICSDGLSDLVNDNFILETVLENTDDLKLSLQQLVEKAKGQGGRDNITIVLAQKT